ncbi:MAG: pilus assembly protein, partial [Mesorhizobium sp.]
MIRRFAETEEGAAMVEMTIVATLLFALTLGFVDFGYAFYQWNAATKAVQVGARLASIS